jgi:mannobiose 2-epimerase
MIPLALWDLYARFRSIQAPSGLPAVIPTPTEPPDAARYHRHLADALLPFWASRSLDLVHGGYFNHLDGQGNVYDGRKDSVMQGRTLYAFARGYEQLGKPEYLEHARHGFQFMADHLWDTEYGGWFQTVSREGEVLLPAKRVWDQAFVLLGLADYARVSGDGRAFDYATRTWDALERHAWDRRHGGYSRAFSRDWRLDSACKMLQSQLNMLEAAQSLAGASGDQRYAGRVQELLTLILGRMREPKHGWLVESCRADWRYDPFPVRDVVSIGHNLKMAGILARLDADDGNNYLTAAEELMDLCLRHAWDEANGGFFQFVYRNGRLARSGKPWWPQCDGIVTLLSLISRGEIERYGDCLRRLESFAFTHLFDAEVGEWHSACTAAGQVTDARKSSDWKCAYHGVRLAVLADGFLRDAALQQQSART